MTARRISVPVPYINKNKPIPKGSGPNIIIEEIKTKINSTRIIPEIINGILYQFFIFVLFQ